MAVETSRRHQFDVALIDDMDFNCVIEHHESAVLVFVDVRDIPRVGDDPVIILAGRLIQKPLRSDEGTLIGRQKIRHFVLHELSGGDLVCAGALARSRRGGNAGETRRIQPGEIVRKYRITHLPVVAQPRNPSRNILLIVEQIKKLLLPVDPEYRPVFYRENILPVAGGSKQDDKPVPFGIGSELHQLSQRRINQQLIPAHRAGSEERAEHYVGGAVPRPEIFAVKFPMGLIDVKIEVFALFGERQTVPENYLHTFEQVLELNVIHGTSPCISLLPFSALS